jgi:hypothetical protein
MRSDKRGNQQISHLNSYVDSSDYYTKDDCSTHDFQSTTAPSGGYRGQMSDPRLDADPLLSLGPAAFTTFRGMAIQCGVNWSISNKSIAIPRNCRELIIAR